MTAKGASSAVLPLSDARVMAVNVLYESAAVPTMVLQGPARAVPRLVQLVGTMLIVCR